MPSDTGPAPVLTETKPVESHAASSPASLTGPATSIPQKPNKGRRPAFKNDSIQLALDRTRLPRKEDKMETGPIAWIKNKLYGQ